MDIRPTQQRMISEWGRQFGFNRISESGEAQTRPLLDFSRSQDLAEKIGASPDVRPEKVEEGRELIKDPAFPGESDLYAISRLLVHHMEQE